jgi:hypothetical protein
VVEAVSAVVVVVSAVSVHLVDSVVCWRQPAAAAEAAEAEAAAV